MGLKCAGGGGHMLPRRRAWRSTVCACACACACACVALHSSTRHATLLLTACLRCLALPWPTPHWPCPAVDPSGWQT